MQQKLKNICSILDESGPSLIIPDFQTCLFYELKGWIGRTLLFLASRIWIRTSCQLWIRNPQYGSKDPDPYLNVTVPKHWYQQCLLLLRVPVLNIDSGFFTFLNSTCATRRGFPGPSWRSWCWRPSCRPPCSAGSASSKTPSWTGDRANKIVGCGSASF